MSKFHSDATRLLAAGGGRDNINAITHCVTRLRFVLREPQRADVAAIEALASVKGPFTLTYLVGRRRLATEAPAAVNADAAFVAPLEALTDRAGTSGSLGSGHAYGLSDGQGRELLIHIGMDTVELQGAGFTSHVRQGQRVRQGDLLAEVDLPLLRSRGKNPITLVVFRNGEALRLLKTSGPVRAGEALIYRRWR